MPEKEKETSAVTVDGTQLPLSTSIAAGPEDNKVVLDLAHDLREKLGINKWNESAAQPIRIDLGEGHDRVSIKFPSDFKTSLSRDEDETYQTRD